VLTEHAVPIATSGYYAFKARPASARAVADAELIIQIERVFWDRKLDRDQRRPEGLAAAAPRGHQRRAMHCRTANAATEAARDPTRQTVRHHQTRPDCGPVAGSCPTLLPRGPAERALGGRLHLFGSVPGYVQFGGLSA
jgi:hypothetical protein